jgi:hypothetical protein
MMAKKNDMARGILKFSQKIRTNIVSQRRLDPTIQAYAEEAANLIKARTRRGYGVAFDGAPAQRLKKLSREYIDHRKRTRSALSSETSPGKSNLTYSGQMLDSLYARRRRIGNWSINLKAQRDDGKTNLQVARYAAAGGRPFLFLSKSELSVLGVSFRKRFSILVKKGIR